MWPAHAIMTLTFGFRAAAGTMPVLVWRPCRRHPGAADQARGGCNATSSARGCTGNGWQPLRPRLLRPRPLRPRPLRPRLLRPRARQPRRFRTRRWCAGSANSSASPTCARNGVPVSCAGSAAERTGEDAAVARTVPAVEPRRERRSTPEAATARPATAGGRFGQPRFAGGPVAPAALSLRHRFCVIPGRGGIGGDTKVYDDNIQTYICFSCVYISMCLHSHCGCVSMRID